MYRNIFCEDEKKTFMRVLRRTFCGFYVLMLSVVMEDKEGNDLEEVYGEEKAPKIHKFSFLKGFLGIF